MMVIFALVFLFLFKLRLPRGTSVSRISSIIAKIMYSQAILRGYYANQSFPSNGSISKVAFGITLSYEDNNSEYMKRLYFDLQQTVGFVLAAILCHLL